MMNISQSPTSYGKRNAEEQPLDKILQDETLERLVDILRSFGKKDAEIEESLAKDLGLSGQRLKRFLKSDEPSACNGHGADLPRRR